MRDSYLFQLNTLLSELRRRRVFRAAVIYVVVAYGVMQAANNFFPPLRLPEWTLTLVAALCVLGLPIALVLAYVFDLTKEGVRRTEPTTPVFASPLLGVSVRRGLLAGSLALALMAAAWAGYDGYGSRAAIDRSIAVLPFVNLSDVAGNEYFSDGMTDEILTNLSRVGVLRVISRTSVMQYKGTDKRLRQIGAELGVRHILEGSVQRVDNRIRIHAQLIDAQTDEHLWADKYDRDLADVFAVQSEIAREIAHALHARLTRAERRSIERIPTADLEAYQLYLRGRFFWNQRTEEGLAKSIVLFQEAVARDAAYALAYAGLADSYTVLGANGHRQPEEVYPRARAAARTALRLDPTLAQPHAALGLILSRYEWRWSDAVRESERAIQLDPAYATAHHWYAWNLAPLGRLDEALEAIRRARHLDPLSLSINTQIGSLLYYARRYREAERELMHALELDPSYNMAQAELASTYLQTGELRKALDAVGKVSDPTGQYSRLPLLARVHARAGRTAEARGILQELLALSSIQYISPAAVALVYVDLGETDSAFEWLQRAFDERDAGLPTLRIDPAFDPLRSDPRFTGLVEALGLARPQ
jgi:adenylate cyclase